jgi:hypothetical protein
MQRRIALGAATQSITQSFAAGHMMPSFAFYDGAGDVIETHEHKGDFKD